MEGLPEHLLVRILSAAKDSLDGQPHPRLVSTSWRQAFDTTLRVLKPSRWPKQDQRGLVSAIPEVLRKVEHLDLTALELADTLPDVCDAPFASYQSTLSASSSHMDLSGTQLSNSSMQLDLTGAAVLQPRLHLPVHAADDCTSASTMIAAPLMCYVATMWPDAVPHVTPAASLRLWKCLAQLQSLQELRLSGSMLLISGVRTAVDGCSDTASGLQLLQQHTAAESDSLVSTAPSITYTYTLQLPPALYTMTALRSLAINWELHEPQPCRECLSGSRRRSYEGGCCDPSTHHVADPTISLPQHFSALVNLQHLELSGCILHPNTLLPLQGLKQLQQLTLGPGRVNSQALVPLAAAGVLGGLTQLVLKQQASWNVDSVAVVLAALTRVEVLEVHELEMSSADLSATGPQQQVLTAAHMAVLGRTLQRLTWVTCGQRLTAGASFLCPSPSAAAVGQLAQHPSDATSAAAAGPWLGALTALQHLELAGSFRERPALGAPVLDALSSSIAGCSRLEVLSVRGLGLPALPEALAALPLLRCVSIEACAVPRRAALGPEAALDVLGRCRGLQELRLAGCEQRHVPGWLCGLAGVTSLQLQHNYIQDLPDGAPYCGLPAALQCLDLTDNRLREVPDRIVLLSSLRVCVLDGNYLTSLPGSIWDLPVLQELSVQENMLGSLPECSRAVAVHSCCESARVNIAKSVMGSSSGARGPGSAAVVAVAGGGFAAAGGQTVGSSAHHDNRAGLDFDGLSADEEDLLSAVGVVCSSGSSSRNSSSGSIMVPSLSSAPLGASVAVLAVRNNSHHQPCVQHGHGRPLLQREPPACADSLRSLRLSGNQLSELPASFSQLGNLRQLNLRKNQLRTLPDSSGLWGCTRLTQLQLADNHLRYLPAGLAQLQRLEQLDVSGNHLSLHIQRERSHAVPAAVSATTAVAKRTSYGRHRRVSDPGSCSMAHASRDGASKSGPVLHCPGVVTVLLESSAAAPHVRAHTSSRSTAVRRPAGSLPFPLRNLPALQQLRLGRQQVEESSRCSLQLLLGGLGLLAERVKCLAPQNHQCPVAKAAAAAVAHLTGVTHARRARALQQQQQQQQVDTQRQGEVVPGSSRKRVCMDA